MTPPNLLPVDTPIYCTYNKTEYTALWQGGDAKKVLLDADEVPRSLGGWVKSIALRVDNKVMDFDGWNKCYIKEGGRRRSLYKVREAALWTPKTRIVEEAPVEAPVVPVEAPVVSVVAVEAPVVVPVVPVEAPTVVVSPVDLNLIELSNRFARLRSALLVASGVPAIKIEEADVSASLPTTIALPAVVLAPEFAEAVAEAVAEPVAEAHAYVPMAQADKEAPLEDLIAAYTFNTGLTTCFCKHCHKAQPLACFSRSLRKQAQKGEIGKTLLKTCDRQKDMNDRANPFANLVSNTKTSLKTWTEKRALATSPEDFQKAEEKLALYTTKLAEAIQSRVVWDAENPRA
jgi:hypothetical protein